MRADEPIETVRWYRTPLRWLGGFILILMLHASVVAAIWWWRPASEPVPPAPEVLMELDLAMIAQAPPSMEEVALPDPEPNDEPVLETEPEPDIVPEPEPEPEIELEPELEPEPVPEPEPEPQPKPQAVPPPEPVKPKPRPQPKPRPAQRKAATAPSGESKQLQAAKLNWHQKIVARLHRYKRYPKQARRQREEGVAHVAFTLDRNGRVMHANISRSSGSSRLDAATLDLLQRAQPLPKPPQDMPGDQFKLVVPVDYSLH